MTDTLHSTPDAQPGAAEMLNAAEQVVCILTRHMTGKQERRARKEIDRFIQQIERNAGLHMPANVVTIRTYPEQRQQALLLSIAVRAVAGPVDAPVLS